MVSGFPVTGGFRSSLWVARGLVSAYLEIPVATNTMCPALAGADRPTTPGTTNILIF